VNALTSALAIRRTNAQYGGRGREWATPPEIFEPLHAEFGFTLDACATADNAKLPRFYGHGSMQDVDDMLERAIRGG
jgi:hypothetical protein